MIDVLERIKSLREEKGWPLYRLAEEAMLTQSTLNNMYKRKTLPSLVTLSQICDAFDITLSDFFNENSAKDEAEISSVYKKLNAKDRETVLALAKYLKNNDKTK